MTLLMPDVQAVLQRLEKLERQNRRIRRAVAVFTILVSALVLMSAAGHKGRVIEARQIVLKDDAGNTRAILGMRSAGPGLALYDASGNNVQALLAVLHTGPAVSLYDADGTTRVLLAVTPKGATLAFDDPPGKLRAEVGFSADAPHLTFFDGDGNPVYVAH